MDNNKIRLNVLGISYSGNTSKEYVLIVGEQNGKLRIPIVIGGTEAQSIALQLERLSPPRPLTHDLFFQFARIFGIEILEINIVRFDKGVFYSEILCFNGEKEVILESRTSDAIALALRFRCPIFIVEDVMKETGVILDNEIEINKKQASNKNGKSLKNKTLDELNIMLIKAIDKEDYEKASEIRDEIKQKEKLNNENK
jgi:bifunctional DNase/RNase